MRLSSLFVQDNQPHIESGSRENSSSVEQGLKNGMEEIAGKAPGQSVTGEILERQGNDVLIAIGKNQLLRAKLDGSMMLETGRQITFSIKNMMGGKIVLSPLYENMGNVQNASKALQMAGIPENEESLKLVVAMMKEGLPVDKDSLRQMMGNMTLFPGADVETLVQLQKLGIPITQDSIFQMDAYKNYQHQITDGLLEIADSLTAAMQELGGQENGEEGIAFLKQVLSLLTEHTMEAQEGAQGQQALTEESAQSANGQAVLLADEAKASLFEDAALQKEQGEGNKMAEQLPALPKDEMKNLLTQLKQAGVPEQTLSSFSEGKLTAQELLKQINALLSENLPPENREGLSALMRGKEWNHLLKNEMLKQWLITPQEVGKENKVEELYERLNSQMSRLSQALEQVSRGNTPLAKAVSNLSGNIDFMNQLNQMFTYVQLPLKLQGKEANGDLYVYTNKRNLAGKDGEVSAFLHLDMEHLGSVDVHVSLKDQKVNTKFSLQDDSALDLIASHIDLLNERLEKRGYSMNASFTVKEGETSVMEEILKKDKPVSLLAAYSFDARV